MATIRYLVADVDASIKFYELLGFSLKDRWGPPFAIVSRSDLDLWLSGPGTSAAKPMPDGRKPGPGGWNRFVIGVDDLEATVARMKSARATILVEAVRGPAGQQALVSDPSGNPVELFERRKDEG
ncbi:MAG: VOC family protein [Hyphomonadaceae bacterium]|jgi:catechol 2,3-dioxygenase-like lactoylglutathione lyase family enzyme